MTLGGSMASEVTLLAWASLASQDDRYPPDASSFLMTQDQTLWASFIHSSPPSTASEKKEGQCSWAGVGSGGHRCTSG